MQERRWLYYCSPTSHRLHRQPQATLLCAVFSASKGLNNPSVGFHNQWCFHFIYIVIHRLAGLIPAVAFRSRGFSVGLPQCSWSGGQLQVSPLACTVPGSAAPWTDIFTVSSRGVVSGLVFWNHLYQVLEPGQVHKMNWRDFSFLFIVRNSYVTLKFFVVVDNIFPQMPTWLTFSLHPWVVPCLCENGPGRWPQKSSCDRSSLQHLGPHHVSCPSSTYKHLPHSIRRVHMADPP